MSLRNWIETHLGQGERRRERVLLTAGSSLLAAAFGMGAIGLNSMRAVTIPPVFQALSTGDTAAIHAAINADRSVLKAKDVEGNTPLHIAAASGWVEVVHALLEGGADPNAKNNEGRTPLFTALEAPRWGQGQVVSELLAKGASTTVALPDGQTVLHVAANTPTTDPGIMPLLARDKSLLHRTDNAGKTPLQLAQAANFGAVARILRSLDGVR